MTGYLFVPTIHIMGGIASMIGKPKFQYSLLDGVFNRRTKKSRTDAPLRKNDQFVDLRTFEHMCEPMYKPSKKKGYFGYKGHIGGVSCSARRLLTFRSSFSDKMLTKTMALSR